jgi:hypothetical protein
LLSHFFRQLFSSVGIFFRTIRAFLTRRLVGFGARIKRMFNFSRKATKVATEAIQGAATAVKKPTKREDYIETKRLFISKSFLITLAIGLVAAGCLIYFVVWPFLLSNFFTAHFHQADGRVKDWSGRVVVYYDADRKEPMYEGRLEKGMLQNEGTLYDENGLMTYQGNFMNGLPNGKGKAYEAGVLVYVGSFADGVYEGTGELYKDGNLVYKGAFSQGLFEGIGELYENGELVYKGAFSGGAPNGIGTAYENGVKVYEGSMLNGQYSGQGTLFYPSGRRAYVGSFAAGLQDGEGTAYRDDGGICYKGSFAEGLYEGDGVYYLEGNQGTIRASFVAGRTDGAIEWYVDGKLWYAGSADDLTPDGFGTLYAKNGKPVYAGEMDRGTLDGAWLLRLSVDELRAAFCEATLTETDGETGGFLIINQELGLTALCSFRQEDADAAVCALWLADGGEGALSTLVPWKNASEFGVWAAGLGEAATEQDGFSEAAVPAGAMPEGAYEPVRYAFGDWSVTALLKEGSKTPSAVRWDSARPIPAPADSGAKTDPNAPDARLDQMLQSLKLIDGSGKKGSKKPSGSDVARLISLLGSANDAQTLVDTLLHYDINKQTLSILEESRTLLQQLLAEEQENAKRGAGNEKQAQALQTQLENIENRIATAKADMEKAALKVQELTLLNPADYALEKLICSFDPSKLDANKLYTAAVEYAQNVAAGLYEVDADKLAVTVKAEIINLELAYQTLQSVLNGRQRAQERADEALKSYARSTIDRYELYQIQIARNDATIALYDALAGFTRQANVLNGLSGGWISTEYQWLDDALPAIYQNEINKGQAEAEAREEEQRRKEQEAREQLEEGRP